MAAPTSPELAELVTAQHVDRILTTLLDSYETVVIDAGSWLDERTMTVFEHAETVIFAICPEISALKALHGLLEYLNEAGTVAAKSTFVLNNQFAREILKLRDVESALGTRVASELPYDAFLYLKAVNEGVPIVLGAPRSLPAERFEKLAATAFGMDGITVPEVPAPKRTRRLGGLIRR
jgi:pilus assembly protein CpaE